MPIKHHIQVVVVLYKCSVSQSKSLTSIIKLKPKINDLFNLDILVYNNSPQTPISSHPDFQVYNSPSNSMLAGAYNYALQLATDQQIKWLLLLDQDTTLNYQYFYNLHNSLSKTNNNTACITPIITHNNKQISPVQYIPFFGPKWFLKPSPVGINNSCLFAFNSGSLINTSAISAIGNFPTEFPLDDLDICYFYRLYRKNFSTYVMPITIEHQLSVLDYAKNMTPERYQSILHYDKLMAKEIGISAQIALSIRVFIRAILQLFSKHKRKYTKQTLKSLITKTT
jgi:GT2 family glycosyltransferase